MLSRRLIFQPMASPFMVGLFEFLQLRTTEARKQFGNSHLVEAEQTRNRRITATVIVTMDTN